MKPGGRGWYLKIDRSFIFVLFLVHSVVRQDIDVPVAAALTVTPSGDRVRSPLASKQREGRGRQHTPIPTPLSNLLGDGDVSGDRLYSLFIFSVTHQKMVEYVDSSQFYLWHFASVEELDACRCFANFQARQFLYGRESGENAAAATAAEDSSSTTAVVGSLPVSHFACDSAKRAALLVAGSYAAQGPLTLPSGDLFLTAAEEAVLVSFYVSKLPALIGPGAEIRRLRRESKVLATAAALYRRFYLSNSVMLFDPKVVMVAAAFLGSKVEDATADVRYLEEGTAAMNAAVLTAEIVTAEVALLAGTHFHLLCFHPYKAVLALTEDLRTFLKTAAGKRVVPEQEHQLTGQDLKPMYDAARNILDDVVVSDIPLLYSPGQIGLAALTVAQESDRDAGEDGGDIDRPQIDLLAYLAARFPHEEADWMPTTVQSLTIMLRQLKDGRHGCGNYHAPLLELKGVHKKLKSVRAWGVKKAKKRKTITGDAVLEASSKRTKLE